MTDQIKKEIKKEKTTTLRYLFTEDIWGVVHLKKKWWTYFI